MPAFYHLLLECVPDRPHKQDQGEHGTKERKNQTEQKSQSIEHFLPHANVNEITDREKNHAPKQDINRGMNQGGNQRRKTPEIVIAVSHV
jgi:hypothetical protein